MVWMVSGMGVRRFRDGVSEGVDFGDIGVVWWWVQESNFASKMRL